MQNGERYDGKAEDESVFRVEFLGVTDFDLARWKHAWRILPHRLSWVRLVSMTGTKVGYMTVVEVDSRRFEKINGIILRGSDTAEIIWDAMDAIASDALEADYCQAELGMVPEASEADLLDDGSVIVDWPLYEATSVWQAVRVSGGDVGKIALSRIRIGEEVAILKVRLPERLGEMLDKLAGDGAATLSARVLSVITAACEAEGEESGCAATAETDDGAIPF